MQEQLTITRDGELVQAPLPVRIGATVLEVLKTATAASMEAVGQSIGQAVTDISLYYEDRELWTEWRDTRRAEHKAQLRTTYM